MKLTITSLNNPDPFHRLMAWNRNHEVVVQFQRLDYYVNHLYAIRSHQFMVDCTCIVNVLHLEFSKNRIIQLLLALIAPVIQEGVDRCHFDPCTTWDSAAKFQRLSVVWTSEEYDCHTVGKLNIPSATWEDIIHQYPHCRHVNALKSSPCIFP